MKKAAFIVATQYDNLGDLIINKCLIDELAKHVHLYIDTENVSEEFVKQLRRNPKVKFLNDEFHFSFKKMSLLKFVFSHSKEFSFLFKSPGPIFYRKKTSVKDILRKTIFNIIYKSIQSGGGKSYIIGSEITFEDKNLVDKFLKTSVFFEKFLLRSEMNVDYLKSINIKNAEYIPDLCFLAKEGIRTSELKNKVGISFRNLLDDTLNENIVRSVGTYVDFYLSKGFEVVFFHQVARDHDFTKQLYNLHNTKENVSFIEKTILLDEIGLYENFRAVMSNRLHVLLLGFIHNALTLPLIDNNSSTNKIRGIYSSIGSSLAPFTLLEEDYLTSIETKYISLIEETKMITNDQYEICVKKIVDIFNQS